MSLRTLGLVLRGRPFDAVLVAEMVHSQKATGHSRGGAEVRLGWGEARQASGSGN